MYNNQIYIYKVYTKAILSLTIVKNKNLYP